ncbi:MAG: hypothetical protein H6625_03605 [Bdellovibrionaceae bacterium]|nr:hypothetical protein [Pseudobdellovibrionaceae bacterium]
MNSQRESFQISFFIPLNSLVYKIKIAAAFVFISIFINSQSYAQVSVQEKIGTGFNPWSYSYFGLFNQELKSMEEGGARLSSYNFLTASYKLGSDNKIAFRLPFSYNSYGFDEFNGNSVQNQELIMQDVFVSFVDYNLILLPLDIGVYWEARIYAPTSESSQDIKLISRFRNDFIFSKYITSEWVLEYVSKLSYYYQSQTAYENNFIDENGFEVSTVSRTKKLEYDHWLNIWFRLMPELSFGWLAGWEDTYYNKSNINNGRNKPGKHEYKMGPQVSFELSPKANFIFQVSENIINSENRQELAKFKNDNLEMTLLAFLRF